MVGKIMTPTELLEWARRNESTCTNVFPTVKCMCYVIGITLILFGIKLLNGRNSIGHP
jgi:hypothetical protein